MYFPEENYSHSKQEKFSSEFNESKSQISMNKRTNLWQILTHYQLNELEQIFNKNKNQLPSIYIRKELAKKMGVSHIKIYHWFSYRIRMWKRTSGSDCKSESKSLLNKREYKKFKPRELIELERIFEKNHYPDKNIINDLAQRMGVSQGKIWNWFGRIRHKLKKQVSSSTSAECGYDNFITSSNGDVNYPSAPFYSRAETMPPGHPYEHPQIQKQYSFHHVPLTHQWTDSDTQSFSIAGSSTYCFPATVTYPQSVLTSL